MFECFNKYLSTRLTRKTDFLWNSNPLAILLQYSVPILLTVLNNSQFYYDYDSLAKATKTLIVIIIIILGLYTVLCWFPVNSLLTQQVHSVQWLKPSIG